MPSFLFGLIH
jgi:hypothetical protein